jgi:TolB-like protein/DNA-binding winged helix-turn-helix (wHTH) protein/Tfp pilus assembly protein PilF
LQTPAETRWVRFGAFEIDLRSGELHKHGSRIRLQEQPFQILLLLLEHPGEVVTREELQQKLWPADTFVDFEVGLNNAVKRLRDTLSDSADTPRFIETLPRRGYRFIASVETNGREKAAEAALAEPPAAVLPPEPKRSLVPRGWLAAGAALLLLVAVVGLNLAGLRQRLFPPPPAVRRLAVLPLKNLTGDPTQEYFVDGMTEALTTQLAQISALSVISRQSAERYRDSRKGLPEIAGDLKVDAVVQGAVAQSGKSVRIDVQLIYAATDGHIWAESYERSLTDILQLQSEVAQAIATQIRVKLTPQEQARLAEARLVNPEAYQAYIKGLFFFDKRTREAIRTGIGHFEQAIQLDPGFAPAYAGLANAYIVLGTGLPADLPPKEAASKAKAAALKAIELDSGLAEGHAALGHIKSVYERDFPGAEKEFRLAIELKPGLATAHLWFANSLRVQQRTEEARQAYRRALELDPVSPNINGAFADFLWYDAGQREQALEQMRKTLELDPHQFNNRLRMGHFYLVLKRYREALAEFKKAEEISPGSNQALSRQGYIHAVLGNRAEAERILGELTRDAEKAGQPGQVAYVYAGLQRKEETLRWLEKSCVARDREILSPIFATRHEYEFLHSDPRFQVLVRCVNQVQKAN